MRYDENYKHSNTLATPLHPPLVVTERLLPGDGSLRLLGGVWCPSLIPSSTPARLYLPMYLSVCLPRN